VFLFQEIALDSEFAMDLALCRWIWSLGGCACWHIKCHSKAFLCMLDIEYDMQLSLPASTFV
jgi:hypothetical protein